MEDPFHASRLWLVKWPDGSVSLVSATNHADLLGILDEVADTSGCTWIPYTGPVYVPMKFAGKPTKRVGFQSCDGKGTLLRDMRSMMSNDAFYDVILKSADGKEVKAHKCIVASRCQAFKQLLAQAVNPAELVLADLSHVVLDKIVEYLYTGELNESQSFYGSYDPSIVLSLLEASCTYGLGELAQLTQQHLVSIIDRDGDRMGVPALLRCYDVAMRVNAAHLRLPPLHRLANHAHEEGNYEAMLAHLGAKPETERDQFMLKLNDLRRRMKLQPIEQLRMQTEMRAILNSGGRAANADSSSGASSSSASRGCTQGLEHYRAAQLDAACILHYACANCTPETALYIVGLGADVNRADDEHGTTPLHVCAARAGAFGAGDGGHAQLVGELVAAGADARRRDDAGRTPAAVCRARIQDAKAFHVAMHGSLRGWEEQEGRSGGGGGGFTAVLDALEAAEAAARGAQAREEHERARRRPRSHGGAGAEKERKETEKEEKEEKEEQKKAKEKGRAEVPFTEEFIDSSVGVGGGECECGSEWPDWLRLEFGSFSEHGRAADAIARAARNLALPTAAGRCEELRAYLSERCVEGGGFRAGYAPEGVAVDSVAGEELAHRALARRGLPAEVGERISGFSARVSMVNALKAAVAEDLRGESLPRGAFDCTTAPLGDAAGAGAGAFDY